MLSCETPGALSPLADDHGIQNGTAMKYVCVSASVGETLRTSAEPKRVSTISPNPRVE